MTNKPEPMLWLSDSRGVYIPRDFARSFANREKNVTGVDAADWEILEAGPDHESYWDAWQEVEQSATVTDDNGNSYSVYQDGDCWLIPHGMEYSDESGFFVWPDENDDSES